MKEKSECRAYKLGALLMAALLFAVVLYTICDTYNTQVRTNSDVEELRARANETNEQTWSDKLDDFKYTAAPYVILAIFAIIGFLTALPFIPPFGIRGYIIAALLWSADFVLLNWMLS